MTPRIALMCLGVLATPAAMAADGAASAVEIWQATPETVFEARDVDIDAFKWQARPVVIFADSPENPAFQSQMQLLEARRDELQKRDVVVIVDTDPGERSALRKKLRPRGFMLTLIGKDGGVKLRKPFPWNVRELTRQIDKMPIRQQEIRDALAAE